MNAHLIISAVQQIEEAITLTPNQEERDELANATHLLRLTLQRRGWFLGPTKPEPVVPQDPDAYYPGVLYLEQDGDKHPLDTYICQSGKGRLLTMEGHNTVSMRLAAGRIVAVMNAARKIESPKLIEAAPLLLAACKEGADCIAGYTLETITDKWAFEAKDKLESAITAAEQPYKIPCQSTDS